jgi:hypothetical protein
MSPEGFGLSGEILKLSTGLFPQIEGQIYRALQRLFEAAKGRVFQSSIQLSKCVAHSHGYREWQSFARRRNCKRAQNAKTRSLSHGSKRCAIKGVSASDFRQESTRVQLYTLINAYTHCSAAFLHAIYRWGQRT